ncbi:Protein adenylyltransferase SelO, mitochondrial [Halotydeus destructor]|nr:Protein adenylyltransferase SelO, mitochondrial [Halotydeus destructor]
MASAKKFDFKLNFDNKVLRTLPIDPVEENYVRTVGEACFSLVSPAPVKNPKLVIHSKDVLELLDIPEQAVEDQEFAEYFSGNKLLDGSRPAAHCYCGYQFGTFAGQLGDGAAMYLGEVVNSKNERWELQFKGAGLTPYSRTADGRKVLRSSLREFLCSEAMAALGIATTRAATCVTSDDRVDRDIFYDGHPIRERCTIITRVASTFIRFGSFEIFKTRDPLTGRVGPSVGRDDMLKTLADYVVDSFYAEITKKDVEVNGSSKYAVFFEEVVRRTAKLVALWQTVGFCHGVLNTDNMSIMGLTLDYGPFGFMEKFDPSFICNTSDDGGRYSYKNQPSVCKWNLSKLAEALKPLLPFEQSSKIINDVYDNVYDTTYMEKMRNKLGLFHHVSDEASDVPNDKKLEELFMSTMASTMSDFTNSFRVLSQLPYPSDEQYSEKKEMVLLKLLKECATVEDLVAANDTLMDSREMQLMVLLMRTNVQLIQQLGISNDQLSLLQSRLEKAQELKTMSGDDKRAKDKKSWEEFLDEYSKRLAHEEQQDSEKGDNEQSLAEKRVRTMNANNPRFVLRNYLAQYVIEKAENGDYKPVKELFDILMDPYTDKELAFEEEQNKKGSAAGVPKIEMYEGRAPPGKRCIKVSCSS